VSRARRVRYTSQATINASFNAAARAILDSGWAPSRLVVLGRSIGTGPAAALAAHVRDCAAMILLSPYCAMREVETGHIHFFTGRPP